jgi:hypothetical protein
MSREEQMMAEADAYAAGAYADEPVCFSTEEAICETINDFVAGWRAADAHPQWIPVEEELPKINDVASSWDCSDEVYIYLATGSHCIGRYEHDKNTNEFYWALYGVDKDIPVTHWMPLPTPPQGKEDKK